MISLLGVGCRRAQLGLVAGLEAKPWVLALSPPRLGTWAPSVNFVSSCSASLTYCGGFSMSHMGVGGEGGPSSVYAMMTLLWGELLPKISTAPRRLPLAIFPGGPGLGCGIT